MRLPSQLINLLGVISAELERHSLPELPVTPATLQIHSTSPAEPAGSGRTAHA
jgi:hypothetical protein